MSDLQPIITYNPISIRGDATIEEALQLLDEMDFHHLPVVDEHRTLIGILTDYDVVRAVARSRQAMCPTGGHDNSEELPRTVDQVMTEHVVSIGPSAPQQAALSQFLDNFIHALPVIDNKQLVGIVTSTDFVRELAFGAYSVSHDAVEQHAIAAGDSIDAESTLDEAAEAMAAANADFVAVDQGGLPLGVISQRELQSAQCAQLCRESLGPHMLAGRPTSVAEIVAQAPSVFAGQSLRKAAAEMYERHLQAVAVVKGNLRQVGVLTETAILQAILDGMNPPAGEA